MTKSFEEEFEQELDYFIETELSLDEKLSFGARDVLVKFFSGWHSPEHVAKEIQMQVLKSQQQPLPEVPEYVASWIEYWKSSGRGSISIDKALTEGIDLPDFKKVHAWLSEYEKKHDENAEPFENMNGVELPNVTLFIRAWLDGYTVQKPKRFYLKNKLTGKYLRSYTGLSMDDTTLRYEDVENKKACGFGGGTTFTQEEIDSMQTGSYEKIEVEE